LLFVFVCRVNVRAARNVDGQRQQDIQHLQVLGLSKIQETQRDNHNISPYVRMIATEQGSSNLERTCPANGDSK